MRVTAATLRDFRNYERAAVELGPGLTVVAGPNGAGKTNLLEGIYFGCLGRSPRTSNERELIRVGASVARVTVETCASDGAEHLLEVGLQTGQPKSIRIDGAAVDNLFATYARPLASVFLPDRLELVKGAPASRRAHLDQFIAAVWPARAATRSAYSSALSQRNALLARVRSGASSQSSLGTWDSELARHGIRLMADRSEVVELLAGPFSARSAQLGLPEAAALVYRPRSEATDRDELVRELGERRAADLDRGFTAHGPHRDDVRLAHDGRSLRQYGSQGQQRIGLLALLFAERDVLAAQRDRTPLMLLDDVMSELDVARRQLLAELLTEEGQSILTTTELDHVPGVDDGGVATIAVEAGTAAPRVGGGVHA
ncbi:MAG: DNA replication/repair protein RecF [Thermoleophilaceae bacterium]